MPLAAGVLLKHREQIDEGRHRVSGCAKVGIADFEGAMLHEGHQRIVWHEMPRLVAAREDGADVGQQDVEILRRQILEPQDRP